MWGEPLDLAEVRAFIDREFPQVHEGGRAYEIEAAGSLAARVRVDVVNRHLRPGGTVSGPTMMALADLAAYVAILASVGPVALAVTTSFNINFLRRPKPGALVADCRVIKLGRRLAVSEVEIRAQGDTELVAHAVLTYALPPHAAPHPEPVGGI